MKKSIFKTHDIHIKHIYQLRVGLSPLRSHKKRHNFIDTPDDRCRYGTGIETAEHFLLECPFSHSHRNCLLKVVNPIISKASPNSLLNKSELVETLLYRNKELNDFQNKAILSETIKYIVHTERFSSSLWTLRFGTSPSPPRVTMFSLKFSVHLQVVG